MPTSTSVESEADFANWFEDALSLHGWRFHHCETSWSRGRFRTAISGHPGFPDYVCVRGDVLFFVEIKSKVGRLTQEQHDWNKGLTAAGAIIDVWRPADRDEIMRVLL